MWRLGFVTRSLESYFHFNKRIEKSHRIRQASAIVTIKNDKIGIETFFSRLVLRIKVGIQPQLFSLAKDSCIFNFQKRLPILANLGEVLTPNFGQTFGTFVRSAGPLVALYNRAVVCENYSVITVSLVSQSSAINLSVEMRIPNPKYKGRTRKIPQLRTQPIHVQPYIFCIVFSYRESCVQRLPDAFNKFNCKLSQRC